MSTAGSPDTYIESIVRNYEWGAPHTHMYSDFELGKLRGALQRVDAASADIVLASWENRWAAAGGLLAVTREYSRQLKAAGRRVHVVSPYHVGLQAAPPPLSPVAKLEIEFASKQHRAKLLKFEQDHAPWYFLQCEGFFNAEGGRDRTNPYLYTRDQGSQPDGDTPANPSLLRDSLFFSIALPSILAALKLTTNVVAHLQDWETAAAAITIKRAILEDRLQSVRSVLTIHNPYDNGLSEAQWAELSGGRQTGLRPLTVLKQSLSLLDAPPATVSREFAKDLTTDPLQTEHFAPHLQDLFRRFGVVGVDNGPFAALTSPFSQQAISSFDRGDSQPLLQEKQLLRRKMIDALRSYAPEGRFGSIDFAPIGEAPVFMCVGRLDPGQKGFDVAARAITQVLKDGLNAGFILTPVVGNAPQAFIDDLEALGDEYAGCVVVYPFRMQQGYLESQSGSTFSLWPSMYEPFGGVSEFLLKGTPVVARSTGGLRQQIVGLPDASANGLLYRTSDPSEGHDNWSNVQAADPAGRIEYPLYRDQVEQLATQIKRAAGIYTREKTSTYARLLRDAFDAVTYPYSWARAAHEYAQLYAAPLR